MAHSISSRSPPPLPHTLGRTPYPLPPAALQPEQKVQEVARRAFPSPPKTPSHLQRVKQNFEDLPPIESSASPEAIFSIEDIEQGPDDPKKNPPKAAGAFRSRLAPLVTGHPQAALWAPLRKDHPGSPPLLKRPASSVAVKPSGAVSPPREFSSEDVGTASSQLQSAEEPPYPPGTLSPSVIGSKSPVAPVLGAAGNAPLTILGYGYCSGGGDDSV